MSVTIDDFNKIWASTSPLTPYSFTDANYQDGWDFIGNTPPSRQMWDFLQKNNDEKAKFIVDNFLPLSGGTMTGTINSTVYPVITATVDSSFVQINGGTEQAKGAWLRLNGKDNQGSFQIRANDGTNEGVLIGKPNGTLTWGGNNLLTDATVGTVLTDSMSETTTLPSQTGVALASVNCTAGTWVVTGHVRFSIVASGKVYACSLSTVSGGVNYASDGATCFQASSTTGSPLQVAKIFTLVNNATVYLNAYANEASSVNAAEISAVRIV